MINAYCFYRGSGGWASHARGLLPALDRIEEVALVPWDAPLSPGETDAETARLLENARRLDPQAPCFGIGSIESMPQMPGRRRKAMVVWEPDRVPADKLRILESLEELWTPSTWGRAMLLRHGIAPEKVWVTPGGVDAESFRPRTAPRDPDEPFRFLSVGKWEERKNFGQLVRAYCAEFRAQEKVELVLHCHNPYRPRLSPQAEIAGFVSAQHAPIRLSPPVAAGRMAALYHACDAFVLPTRAEGWGLPVVEAMACGLAVIVTAYSAPVDYLNESNGYPLRVAAMTAVYDPYFYPAGVDLGQWAEPDFDHLRHLMRHVFEHREEAREKGRMARAAVCAHWTWDHAARTAYRRLRPEALASGVAP